MSDKCGSVVRTGSQRSKAMVGGSDDRKYVFFIF